mgnify:FL=1
MNIEDTILDLKSEIVDLTCFSFHVVKATDDGGTTIDIYVVPDDVRHIQSKLSKKYGRKRLIYYSTNEQDILLLIDKNV